jgi:kynureninase
VDFAVWYTYKYLNSCTGTAGGMFVHEKHLSKADPGLKGWFGVSRKKMCDLNREFEAEDDARKFQINGYDPFHYARLEVSLDLIEQFGGITNIKEKNDELYDYVYNKLAAYGIEILSPKENG